MKTALLTTVFALLTVATSALAADLPKMAPEEAAAIEKGKVEATLKLIDGSNLRGPFNFFGSALVTILTTDAENLAKKPDPIKGVADSVIPTLLAHGPLIDLRDHCASVSGIALVAYDLISSQAFTFTYIAVGIRGPVAIKIDAYVAPDKVVYLADITIVEAWPDIEDLLAKQKRLPAQLNVHRPKKDPEI